MTLGRVSTSRFVAATCRKSFYEFFLEFWSTIAAERLQRSWYIRKLCDELQVLSERVFLDRPKEYDLIWNCPPGTSKSSVLSVLWQPWVWTRMPSARFITGSYSERLALDLSRKSRDVIVSDKYRELFPEIKLRDDQNTKSYFVNTKGGMRYATGVGGSVIGMHAHFIGIDDPIDPQGVLSDLILEEANVWMTETLSRRKVDVMLTPTALIMQRLHQADPTGLYLERGTPVKHFKIPCDTSWDIQPLDLRNFYIDSLLDPARLPKEALEEAYLTLGESSYAGQYGQNPVPKGGAMFKVDRLLYQENPPSSWKKPPIRYWDKASTAGGGAFTVGTKMAMDNTDHAWVLDVRRGQWDTGTREDMIVSQAEADGKTVRQIVEEEPGSGGKHSAEATVRRLTLKGYRASAIRPSGDKELRADPFSQYVNLGMVILLVAPWNRTFVEELRFFPRSRYKDQVDSSSGGFSWLTRKAMRIGAL